MINAVLVDDEPGQVSEMAAIIQKIRPEFQVLEATSGDMALEFLESNPIDVIITDIKMPLMDGLELIQNIVKLQHNIIIVILSGYGEFHYAQRAIQLGVFEYLVKPISKKSLETLLCRIHSVITEKKEELEGKKTLQKKLKTSLPVYKEHLFNKWLHNDLCESEWTELSDSFPLEGQGMILVTKIENYKKRVHPLKPDEIENLLQCYKERIANTLEGPCQTTSFLHETQNDTLVTLLLWDKENSLFECEALEKKLHEVIENTNCELGMKITIGVSNPSDHIAHSIHECFEQAVSALDFSYFSDCATTLFYSKMHTAKEKHKLFNMYELENKLTAELKKGNISKLYTILNDTFDELYHGKVWIKPDQLKEYFVYIVLHMLKTIPVPVEKPTNLLMEQLTAKIYGCDNYAELRRTMKEIMESLANDGSGQDVNKNYLLIQQCKKYIDEHYKEELSLEILAQKFYFNSSYLSNVFKTYAGMSYSEYLTAVRIEKAQALLQKSSSKVYVIASEVGYSDATYFIKIFKKRVGVSPYKYRHLFGYARGE